LPLLSHFPRVEVLYAADETLDPQGMAFSSAWLLNISRIFRLVSSTPSVILGVMTDPRGRSFSRGTDSVLAWRATTSNACPAAGKLLLVITEALVDRR
jgi:hypothetical protein